MSSYTFTVVSQYKTIFYMYSYVGLLLFVSIDEPYMPPMMVPSKHHSNYTAVIRVVVGNELGAYNYVDVQFQVRKRCYRSDKNTCILYLND